MTCPSRFLWPLLGALFGCSVGVGELSPSDIAVNECESDSNCHSGQCVDGTCRGYGGELTSLLLAVTPSTAPGIVGFTYYKEYAGLDGDGGAFDISLSPAVDIIGTVSIDTTRDCKPWFIRGTGVLEASPEGGLIPPELTFTPSERVLGVPSDQYGSNLRGMQDFAFEASLAPGRYDVYIRPAYPAALNPLEDVPLCEVPPRLLLNQSVKSRLDYNLAPYSTLNVTIKLPLPLGVPPELVTTETLAGWTVDLIDPVSGRPLSTRAELSDPLDKTKSVDWTYAATLNYAPVYVPNKEGDGVEPSGVGSELIRLSPPVGVTAPVILADVKGAKLFDPRPEAPAAIELASPMPLPVEVEIQTAVKGVPDPVSAGIAFTAKELDGVGGVSTAFSRSLQIEKDEIAKVSLLPGRYRVVASPKSGCTAEYCLGTTIEEWVIPAAPAYQGGKTIEFNVASRLAGRANVATGAPAVGASVRALASTSILGAGVLDLGDARSEVLPRATVGSVDAEGYFEFEADAGTFDFRVEPDPSTGFGWLVKPRVAFPVTNDELHSLMVPVPVVYQGSVTLENSTAPVPIPGALIRAYVYVNADGALSAEADEDTVAVQVTETHADGNGNYTLLVPRVLGSDDRD
jgi:hypothetical protein